MNDNIQNIIVDMKKVKTGYEQDSLSVEEVLNLPTLNGYKLLAGGKGLQKRCKHMTILETPEGISWLEGGEFLVTAGYAFINNEEYKKAMLIDANNKGVSAIAIKENRYFGEISNELIEICTGCRSLEVIREGSRVLRSLLGQLCILGHRGSSRWLNVLLYCGCITFKM